MDTPARHLPPTTAKRPKAPLKVRVGKALLGRLNAHLRVGAPLERVPENLHRTARQLALGLELVDDFQAGRYRAAPWGAIALLSGALLYAMSPVDVLPDALLGLGSLDDAVVLAVATRLVRRQLEAYCDFKGYSRDEYFPPTHKFTGLRGTVPIFVETFDMPAD